MFHILMPDAEQLEINVSAEELRKQRASKATESERHHSVMQSMCVAEGWVSVLT